MVDAVSTAQQLGITMPQVKMPVIGSDLIMILAVLLLAAAILFIIFKLMSHRISVKVLDVVHGGYVSIGSRFRKAYDSELQMTYLKPMFGGFIISNFPNECFQKLKSMPLIGTNRSIYLVKFNRHSFGALIPPTQQERAQIVPILIGSVEKYDVKGWLRALQMQMVKKYMNRTNWLFIFGIIAPSLIIVMVVAIITIDVFTQSMLLQYWSQKIDVLTQIIKAKAGL